MIVIYSIGYRLDRGMLVPLLEAGRVEGRIDTQGGTRSALLVSGPTGPRVVYPRDIVTLESPHAQ